MTSLMLLRQSYPQCSHTIQEYTACSVGDQEVWRSKENVFSLPLCRPPGSLLVSSSYITCVTPRRKMEQSELKKEG